MGSRRRSKKGGRRRRRAGRLPAAAAEAVVRRFNKGEKEGSEKGSTPSSFVIRRGRLTPAARQLVRDMRRVMLPHCGERLRERRSSKLKDYVAAASLLGVSHLQLFTQTDAGLYFKLVQLPAGPTLSFRVLRFSLVHDVQRYHQQQKRRIPRAPDSRDFLHPPLLILSPQAIAAATNRRHETSAINSNAYKKQGEEEKQNVEILVAKVVKSAFPPIDIRTVELRDCRRVVLFRRENAVPCSTFATSSSSGSASATSSPPSSFLYQLRQYAVVRRIQEGTQIVTPGVRALVEAGSSRVAADRMLQQRFGISLQGENNLNAVAADAGLISVSTKKTGLYRQRHPAPSVLTETETETTASEAPGSSCVVDLKQKRKQRYTGSKEEQDSGIIGCGSGGQDPLTVSNKAKEKHHAWRDICEATLAREHSAAADTEDEQCLSFDVSEVKISGAIGSTHGNTTGRRSKDGLLWLSVAAAAHQREKKEGGRIGAAAGSRENDRISGTAGLTTETDHQEDDDMMVGAAATNEREGEGTGDVATEERTSTQPKEEKLKMKVSLVELGPRMHLELVKVEEDVCAGAVVFHNFVKKTSEELSALQQKDAALRQQREEERAAVQQALEKEFQKRKRRKNAVDDSCGNSGDDEADDAGSSAGEETEEPESTEEHATSSQCDTAEDDCSFTGQDYATGEGSPKRKKDHSSSGQFPKRKGAMNKNHEILLNQDFPSECADALDNACASEAAVADHGNNSDRPKVSVKRKRDNSVNPESKTPRKNASAVLRRYEAATARQRGHL